MLKKIIVATHHGFCMGVKRAIKIAEETAEKCSEENPVTILNEIVHNEAVVDHFRKAGVGQVTSVSEIDKGTLIISAHGIPLDVVQMAESKGLTVVDATCPLVTRIYDIIEKAILRGCHIIHFGDVDHDETAGIVGHAPDHITVAGSMEEMLELPDWSDRKLGLTVQTTAHVDLFADIKKRALQKWPHIEIFNTVCNATTQRQSAILDLVPQCDMILVVGSRTSANSNRLADISRAARVRSELIGTKEDIDPTWFDTGAEISNVGVSAGASTPQFLVDEVIEYLLKLSGGVARIIQPIDTSSSIE